MKAKVFILTSLLILFCGLGFINEINAQTGTKVTINITGEYVAGASYAAEFRIWDINANDWYCNWQSSPSWLSYGSNTDVICPIDLDDDTTPNWIVCTRVTRTGGGAPTRIQPGQSSAVTTQQYYTANYVQITVSF